MTSAWAEFERTGDRAIKPRTNGDPPARVVAVGPAITALRGKRSREETALIREVSERITAYREAHGLSQRKMAERMGMPQPNLARLELGLHTPTLETLARLAKAMDTTFTIEVTPQGIRLRAA